MRRPVFRKFKLFAQQRSLTLKLRLDTVELCQFFSILVNKKYVSLAPISPGL